MYISYNYLMEILTDFEEKKNLKENNLKSAVITFKSSPANHFKKEDVKTILSLNDRLQLIENLDVDYAFVVDFKNIAKIEAYDYIKNVENTADGAYLAGYNWCYYYEIPANRELKARVEAYKERGRESARGKLEQLTAQVAEKLSPPSDRPRARAAGMEK